MENRRMATQDNTYLNIFSSKTRCQFFDQENAILLKSPKTFSYGECLVYLWRSADEVLHTVEQGEIFKLLKINGEQILIKVTDEEGQIKIEFLNSIASNDIKSIAAKYVWDWFDFDTDLEAYYHLAAKDRILKQLMKRYYGLRIMKMDDLFETLCWAIIGQQINLTFAYTLKRRFVESFGESYGYNGKKYWLFPTADKISSLSISDLKSLQFTGRKAEYIINLAELIKSGEISRSVLQEEGTFEGLRNRLLKIRGVGAWTADYTIMKCFHFNEAFPIADVGLHNALKHIMGREEKPSIDEIRQMAEQWRGWESYATSYLWRSLYD